MMFMLLVIVFLWLCYLCGRWAADGTFAKSYVCAAFVIAQTVVTFAAVVHEWHKITGGVQ